MSNLNKLFKIARKFELKMAVAAAEYMDIDKAQVKLKEILAAMKQAIDTCPEFQDFIVKFPAAAAKKDESLKDFFSQKEKTIEEYTGTPMSSLVMKDMPLRPESLDVINYVIQIDNLINELNDGSNLYDLCKNLNEVHELLFKLSNKSGEDVFQNTRKNYLHIINTYYNFYMAMKNYHYVGEVNSLVLGNINDKIGKITNTLHTLSRASNKAREVINKVKSEKFLTIDQESKIKDLLPLDNTERVVRPLLEHNKAQFLSVTDLIPNDWTPSESYHGVVRILDREARFYNEFIKQSPDMVLLIQNTWYTPIFKKLWSDDSRSDTQLKDYILRSPKSVIENKIRKEIEEKYKNVDIYRDELENIIAKKVDDEWKQLQGIRNNVEVLRSYISSKVAESRSKEQLKTEKYFGSPEPSTPAAEPKLTFPQVSSYISSNLDNSKKKIITDNKLLVPMVNAITQGNLTTNIVSILNGIDSDVLREYTIDDIMALES
jgi:hypothetical protein